MTKRFDRPRMMMVRTGLAVLAFSACLPCNAVLAQPATDFRLQPGETATPRSQGPVDADAPAVRAAPQETPGAAPAPSLPAATPEPAASGPAASTPSSPTASATAPQPGVQTRAAAATRPGPPAAASVSAFPPAVPLAPSAAPDSPAPVVVETFEPSPGFGSPSQFVGWWLALPAVLLALLAGLLLRRRKDHAEQAEDTAEETLPEPAETAPVSMPQLSSTPLPEPQFIQPVAEADPAPVPAPALRTTGKRLAIDIDVGRMSATLLNATLTWQLTVENHGSQPLGRVRVAGDMIAAHGSLPVEQQLASDDQKLDFLADINMIESGDKVDLQGEFRLPLTAINPIRAGSALLFVPLLRFRLEAEGTTTLATFAVGETPPVAAAALLPFRLDLGPRVWSKINRRQVDRQPLTT